VVAEQTLLNASVLLVDWTSADRRCRVRVQRAAIARAAAALPGHPGLALPTSPGSRRARQAEFARAIRVTVAAIAGFAGAVALGLVLVGPFAMNILFDDPFTYGRWGLALVAIGMSFHLTAGTLSQAALARDRASTAAACWLFTAAPSWSSWSARWSATSCCGRRSATSGRPRCCPLLAVVYRATSALPEPYGGLLDSSRFCA
jgi:hypothetical protein